MKSYEGKLPIVIVRPPMIAAAIGSSLRGYVEGLTTGLSGFVAAAMTGLLRTLLTNNTAQMKATSVDYTANCAIVATCKRSCTTSKALQVFNCAIPDSNPCTWEDACKIMQKCMPLHPPLKSLAWYPRVTPTSCYVWHRISLYLFQLLPAFILDGILLIMNKKPLLVCDDFVN